MLPLCLFGIPLSSSVMKFDTKPVKPVETSDTHPIAVDFLPNPILNLPGKLGMTTAPGRIATGMDQCWERDLNQDLQRLRQHYGTDLLISLLEQREFEIIHTPHLFHEATAHGIQTLWFAIPDLSIPDEMEDFKGLIDRILAALQQGQTVVTHCRGGLGRTGLVVACCLVQLDYLPAAAIARVRQIRPGAIETKMQEKFIFDYQHA